ncbi:MAG: 5-formyltetrahydrofolate cyclo-ligase [Candidatus Promineifilaceae bacterium]|jgi:5-formyltetrahydrofolate cyclo-ligase
MENKTLRWAGRNSSKDQLRATIWTALQVSGAGTGKLFDSIPNFVGAEAAAETLSQQPVWKEAKVVKSNPDSPQMPVRYRALRDGKLLYMPVPELAKEFPFVLLDPAKLAEKEIPFADAARLDGALKYGQRVEFSEMLPMDLLVVGCVAVGRDGGRTGKGGGFADLELGIFREVGIIPPHAKLVTTVHELQVVDNELLTLQAHDSPLDWIVTPNEVIETGTSYPQPKGVYWNNVLPEQFEAIPFLRTLREQLEAK